MVINDAEKLTEIEDLFDFVLRVQDKLVSKAVSPEEVDLGEGRKGVIMIKGGNSWVKVLEVSGGRLVSAKDLSNARTVIVFNGVDVLRHLIQELLAGNVGAFSRARARGEVKVVGEYAIRDLAIFNRLFTTAGKLLSSYDVKLGGE